MFDNFIAWAFLFPLCVVLWSLMIVWLAYLWQETKDMLQRGKK